MATDGSKNGSVSVSWQVTAYKGITPTWNTRCGIGGGGENGDPPGRTDTRSWYQLQRCHQYLACSNKEKREVGENCEEVKSREAKQHFFWRHYCWCIQKTKRHKNTVRNLFSLTFSVSCLFFSCTSFLKNPRPENSGEKPCTALISVLLESSWWVDQNGMYISSYILISLYC